MGNTALVHWNTSTLKAQFSGNSKVIVSTRNCPFCFEFVPEQIRLTLANFSDDCSGCDNYEASKGAQSSGAAAAVNSNSYDLVYELVAGDCWWYDVDLGGAFGKTDYWVVSPICGGAPDSTDTYDGLHFAVVIDETNITITIMTNVSGTPQNMLFYNQTAIDDELTCTENLEGNFSNELSGCYSSPFHNVCGGSGDVTIAEI